MLTTEERIRAIIGNIKNWSWDIYPKFELEKEDATALMEFLKDKGGLSNASIH